MSCLRPVPGGRLDWQGQAGPKLEVVARAGDTLVVWQPGWTFNQSGIRGMPNRIYFESRHIAFRVLGTEPSGALRVEKLVDWAGRGDRDNKPAASA